MQHVLGSLDNNPLLMDALIKKQIGIDCLPFMGMDSKFSPGLGNLSSKNRLTDRFYIPVL
jgi:hypothetical protein